MEKAAEGSSSRQGEIEYWKEEGAGKEQTELQEIKLRKWRKCGLRILLFLLSREPLGTETNDVKLNKPPVVHAGPAKIEKRTVR